MEKENSFNSPIVENLDETILESQTLGIDESENDLEKRTQAEATEEKRVEAVEAKAKKDKKKKGVK